MKTQYSILFLISLTLFVFTNVYALECKLTNDVYGKKSVNLTKDLTLTGCTKDPGKPPRSIKLADVKTEGGCIINNTDGNSTYTITTVQKFEGGAIIETVYEFKSITGQIVPNRRVSVNGTDIGECRYNNIEGPRNPSTPFEIETYLPPPVHENEVSFLINAEDYNSKCTPLGIPRNPRGSSNYICNRTLDELRAPVRDVLLRPETDRDDRSGKDVKNRT